MCNKLEKAKEILKKYDQPHLLYFYDEISDEQKEKLLDQILKVDFEEIINLYKNSLIKKEIVKGSISPLNHIEKDLLSSQEISNYSKIGEDIIKSNSVAVVTMAGGQGSRLGYKGPKGTYELNLEPGKK